MTDSIEHFYDAVASEHAERFNGEHEKKPQDQVILKRFAQAIGDRRPVWDLGCGPGQTTRYLNDLGIEACGLDLAARLPAEARALPPGIHFQQGNLLPSDFEDRTLAGAVAFYAIAHFTSDQVRRAFAEVFRVLRPGGILLLTYHIGNDTAHVEAFLGKRVAIDFMFFPAAFVRNSLETCGFRIIEIIARAPYPGVEYQSRRGYVWAQRPILRDENTAAKVPS